MHSDELRQHDRPTTRVESQSHRHTHTNTQTGSNDLKAYFGRRIMFALFVDSLGVERVDVDEAIGDGATASLAYKQASVGGARDAQQYLAPGLCFRHRSARWSSCRHRPLGNVDFAHAAKHRAVHQRPLEQRLLVLGRLGVLDPVKLLAARIASNIFVANQTVRFAVSRDVCVSGRLGCGHSSRRNRCRRRPSLRVGHGHVRQTRSARVCRTRGE